jgi:hypothetical protein
MTSKELERKRLLGLINGYSVSQAISCAVQLGLPDLLAERPMTVLELATATRCSALHLAKLIRALTTVGIFVQQAEHVGQTSMSDLLRRDVNESLAAIADLHGQELYTAFSGLLSNIRSGSPAWPATMGSPAWEYFSQFPERGAVFDRAMQAHHAVDLQEIAMSCAVAPERLIVDVGGGDGSMLRAVLGHSPNARGMLIDLPGVIARARSHPDWTGVEACFDLVAGDMFTDVPAGGDVYVLRHVLHDWDDPHCLRLLRNCRVAMKEGARLLIIERLHIPQSSGAVAWQDLGIMVFGGTERGADDYQTLLNQAGLSLTQIHSLTRCTILEARVSDIKV